MKKISDLIFGFPDAENYKRRENKELFNKIFIRNTFLEDLLKPEISFLIGDKGTGKTAYATYLSNNIYKNNISTTKFIRETDYKKFISLKNEKHLQLSDYSNIWTVILLLLISEKIYESEPNIELMKNFGKFKYLHDVIEEYYCSAFAPEFINAMEFIEESNLSAELLSKHAKLVGEEKETKKFSEKRFQINLMYIEKKFKEALSKIKLKNNHILFIDGIDIRPSDVNFEDYLDCIKGLAHAVWNLNNDFFPSIRDSKGRARVVLLVRPDIFESIGLQNLNTKIRSNSVLLNWNTDYRDYENSKIFQLIDHVLSVQQNEKLEVGEAWQFYFRYDTSKTEKLKKDGKYTSFIGFLRYSYYRPRDIITMLDYLQKNVTDKNKMYFTEEDFKNKTFRNDFSHYILGEIKDQLLFYYKLEEYELFLKFFEFLNGKPSFKYNEYLKIFEKYSNYIESVTTSKPKFTSSANEFLQFLFDLNIICYIEYSKDEKNKFMHWCFKEKSYSNLLPKVKENKEYQIFYSLTKALKIGKEYEYLEDKIFNNAFEEQFKNYY